MLAFEAESEQVGSIFASRAYFRAPRGRHRRRKREKPSAHIGSLKSYTNVIIPENPSCKSIYHHPRNPQAAASCGRVMAYLVAELSSGGQSAPSAASRGKSVKRNLYALVHAFCRSSASAPAWRRLMPGAWRRRRASRQRAPASAAIAVKSAAQTRRK